VQVRLFAAICVGALLGAVSPAVAQWETQTITLQPGWNAVFLEVQPEPRDPATVFQDAPVESVWMWNRTFSPVQFVQDASTLVPQQPDWLHYVPSSSDVAFSTNLFAILGGRAYLIKVSGSTPFTWQVTGTPLLAPPDWLADSYNLVGLHVDAAQPPTFAAYFAPSPAHASSAMYRLNTTGHWVAVANPASEHIQPGAAYWIFCKGSSNYPGPVRVATAQAGTVDFGGQVTEQLVQIENHATSSRQLSFRLQGSATPPGDQPVLAGEVPLSYWDSVTRNYIAVSAPFTLSVAAGRRLTLRLAVRRADMAPAPSADAVYQSLLELRDGAGVLLTLPVLAKRLTATATGGGGSGRAAAVASSNPQAGLWVGTATINAVNFAASTADPDKLQPTASELQIRLIVHVDASGQANLLQEVTVLWQNGTTKPDPNDSTKMIPDQPGRYVLVTRDALIPQFSGAAVRGGKPVGRRISSAAFGVGNPQSAGPWPLSGTFGDTLTTAAPIVLDYNDPLNPFRHRYHPDHDNLDFDFQTPLLPDANGRAEESYTVKRTLTLTFTATDPDSLKLPGFGDTRVGGTYSENIMGLHRRVLHVAGTFRLHHASRVAVLNDGL
jgi:hypothetical protein